MQLSNFKLQSMAEKINRQKNINEAAKLIKFELWLNKYIDFSRAKYDAKILAYKLLQNWK